MATRAERAAAFEAFRVIFKREALFILGQMKRERAPIPFGAGEQLIRQELKNLYINTFISGKNGTWSSTTASQWGYIGNRLRSQYGFLNTFLMNAVNGGLTDGQISARLDMYSGSARQVLEAGHAATRKAPLSAFPDFPGSGRTECLTLCRCRWTIRKSGRNKWFITWRLGRTERHCKTCPQRARAWRNLEIRDGRMVSEVEPIFAR